MDGGAWQATVHGVAKSWTRLSMHTWAHPWCGVLRASSPCSILGWLGRAVPTLEPLEFTGTLLTLQPGDSLCPVPLCSLPSPLLVLTHVPTDSPADHASALPLLLGRASLCEKAKCLFAAQGSWEHFENVHLHRTLGAPLADQGLSSCVQKEHGGLYPCSRVTQGMQGWVHSGGSASMY